VDSTAEGAHRAGPEVAEEPEATASDRLVGAAVALSIAASMIHASVIVPHFREYWLFGAFFVVAAVFQLVWGLVAWNRRDDRRLLTLGAVANLAIVLLWIATRTAGLPIGPEPGEVEPAGLHDLLATGDEVAIAVACGLALLPESRWKGWLPAPFWVLAIASGILAFPGPHSA
jgi:hypothetical protein